MLNKIIILLASFLLISCSANLESPVIYFSNASTEPVKNIRCEWAKKNVLTLPSLNPGDSRSQSFYIRSVSDFFGLVKLSWENNAGNTISKEFYFMEKNLPSIADHTTYNYIQFYFDQNDFEIISSDAADLPGKTRRMEQILISYRDEYKRVGSKPPQTSLIRVIPQKDSSLPSWLANSY